MPPKNNIVKICHIITSLSQGGAESVLFRLIQADAESLVKHQIIVISLTSGGIYAAKLRELGIEVISLAMPPGRLTLSGIYRLWHILIDYRPDVVQTWMYHADLLGGVVARLSGCLHIVWNIRNSDLAPSRSSISARIAAQICAHFSSFIPAAIICCAEEATRVHQKIGYAPEKFVLIPNGYDLSRFVADREKGKSWREKWSIPDGLPLLGLIARWHPEKDHANLLEALSALTKKGNVYRCVLVGEGMTMNNHVLLELLTHYNIQRSVILAGSQTEIPEIMNALDLHILSSAGEAFPNVVAESMACGVPNVVTDVGDARIIVSDTGWVVPPQNPKALAEAIITALLEFEAGILCERAQKCRERIVENFSIETMVQRYHDVWFTKAKCNVRNSRFS